MVLFKKLIQLSFLTLFLLSFIKCTISAPTHGSLYKLSAQPLSLNSESLRTCIFDSHFSITHFPMWHSPPTIQHTAIQFLKVTLSQFQLLHTILDYNRSNRWNFLLFDEAITSDSYNENFYQLLIAGQQANASFTKLSGQTFFMQERVQTAQTLFGAGIPRYFEHLSHPQLQFLFETGASLILYLLGEIPRIHKVISSQDYEKVRQNIPIGQQVPSLHKTYWTFDFRELALKNEVLTIFHQLQNTQQLLFFAYGAAHDFSDEFIGYPFQSGHNFCIGWEQDPTLMKILP